MMLLLKIAWRNIWRSKLRSLVVIFAVASGLVGGVFSAAWMNGMGLQRVENALSIETSHVQLHNPKFSENLGVTKTIVETHKKLSEISKMKGVLAVTSRLKTSAMASTAYKNMGVTLIGINPKNEKEVFGLYKNIKKGSGHYFEGNKKNTIIISKALAKELKAKLKSKIVLTFQDYNNQITGAAFKIIGIFKTDNSSWDKRHVFVENTDLKNLLGMPKDQTHEIDIKLDDYTQASIIAAKIQQKFPDVLSEDWSKIQPYLSFLTDYMDLMMGIFMLIILGALGFGIVNTMLMVILERTRELGMLMAIGMTKKRIFIVIMFETILLAIVGAVIGELLSLILIKYFGNVGINLSSFAQGLESVGYSAISYPVLEPFRYFQIAVLVLIVGILASVYPAIKALKLNPAEAIRTL